MNQKGYFEITLSVRVRDADAVIAAARASYRAECLADDGDATLASQVVRDVEDALVWLIGTREDVPGLVLGETGCERRPELTMEGAAR